LYQETKLGFKAIDTRLDKQDRKITLMHRDLNNLRVEQQVNMETLTQQNLEINNKLDLMHNGIIGVSENVANLENTTKAGFDVLKQQNVETQSQLNELSQKLGEFTTFAATGMQQMTSMQALLQQLVANLPKQEEQQKK
jgi:hypothetical protein